ncbi:MAG TPA: hypothetical protein DHV57_20470 [Hyphomonas sp.]|nr:hypothetical protein [Hyphomonas sp.]HCJ19784.1 hypothetical protein [Hyphomonas sp.]
MKKTRPLARRPRSGRRTVRPDPSAGRDIEAEGRNRRTIAALGCDQIGKEAISRLPYTDEAEKSDGEYHF